MTMSQLLNLIAEADTIAILGHISPDGDCVGSCLGLYNYIIEHYSKERVQVYLEPFSKDFRFLNGADLVCHNTDEDFSYDLAISLDCGDLLRHGDFGKYFASAKKTACVDHHISNQGFGDYCVVDLEASSASEAVFKLLNDTALSKECAEAFYLGIVHDTGVFKHNSTSKKTMEIAGLLISLGAKSDYIIDHTFYKKTFIQNKLLGLALSKAELFLDGKLIVTCITMDDFASIKASRMDTDGIVDQLRITEGVEVACFVYEKYPGDFKYSLRSNGLVNVNLIATALGGGGHIRAAGVQVKADYLDTLQYIIDEVNKQI